MARQRAYAIKRYYNTQIMSHDLIIYTDGSALGNPGPAGWGYLVWNKVDNTITEGGEYRDHATNNQMELSALLYVLKYLNNLKKSHDIVIYLDSDYVRNGITSWIHNWKKNNWHTANKKPVLNKELWIEIDQELQNAELKHKIKLMRVDGHTGVVGNEIVDLIAHTLAETKTWDHFSGKKDDFEKLRNVIL